MSHDFAYHGKAFDLATLMLKNIVLTVLTLGVYRSWAKTDVRRYIARRVEFMGQHLDYHGTGGELLKGFLIALAINGAFLGLSEALSRYFGEGWTWMLAFIPLLSVMICYTVWTSRRYLLTRLSWGGIRFGMEGNQHAFALKLSVLSMLALFPLVTPFVAFWERKTLTESTRFGTTSFRYTGDLKACVRRTYGAFLLLPFSLGLSLVWLWLENRRYDAACTWLGGVNFRFELSTWEAFKMLVGGPLAIVASFGLATPWVMSWSLGTYLGALRANGQPNFTQIQALEFKAGSVGEGLAGILDVGVAF
jgi:uncharacterized membrane protein YjgN (DUF898 family)